MTIASHPHPESLRGGLGFSVLCFWLFLDCFFLVFHRTEIPLFEVFVFIGVCKFFIFLHLVLSFPQKYWQVFGFGNQCGFQFLLLRFWFLLSLFDLGGNYTPPLILNSCKTSVCSLVTFVSNIPQCPPSFWMYPFTLLGRGWHWESRVHCSRTHHNDLARSQTHAGSRPASVV